MLLGQSKCLNCNEILGHVTDWNNIAIIDSLSISIKTNRLTLIVSSIVCDQRVS